MNNLQQAQENTMEERLKALMIRFGLDLEDRGEQTDWGSVQMWKETEYFIKQELAQTIKDTEERIKNKLMDIQFDVLDMNDDQLGELLVKLSLIKS